MTSCSSLESPEVCGARTNGGFFGPARSRVLVSFYNDWCLVLGVTDAASDFVATRRVLQLRSPLVILERLFVEYLRRITVLGILQQ